MRKLIQRSKTVGSTLVFGFLLIFGLTACGGEDTTYSCADLTITMDETGRQHTFEDKLYHESGNTYSFSERFYGLNYTGVIAVAPDGTITGDGVRHLHDKNPDTDDFTVTGTATLDYC